MTDERAQVDEDDAPAAGADVEEFEKLFAQPKWVDVEEFLEMVHGTYFNLQEKGFAVRTMQWNVVRCRKALAMVRLGKMFPKEFAEFVARVTPQARARR